MEKLLTAKEVAKLVRAKKSTIYAWVSEGYIPYCKVGKFVRFRRKTIESWIGGKETRGRRQRTLVDSGT